MNDSEYFQSMKDYIWCTGQSCAKVPSAMAATCSLSRCCKSKWSLKLHAISFCESVFLLRAKDYNSLDSRRPKTQIQCFPRFEFKPVLPHLDLTSFRHWRERGLISEPLPALPTLESDLEEEESLQNILLTPKLVQNVTMVDCIKREITDHSKLKFSKRYP